MSWSITVHGISFIPQRVGVCMECAYKTKKCIEHIHMIELFLYVRCIQSMFPDVGWMGIVEAATIFHRLLSSYITIHWSVWGEVLYHRPKLVIDNLSLQKQNPRTTWQHHFFYSKCWKLLYHEGRSVSSTLLCNMYILWHVEQKNGVVFILYMMQHCTSIHTLRLQLLFYERWVCVCQWGTSARQLVSTAPLSLDICKSILYSIMYFALITFRCI